MKISEVIDHIKSLHTTEPTQYTNVAHKPLQAYLKNVAKVEDSDIIDVFQSIDDIYDTFKDLYKPNTVRNYIRCLRQMMDLDVIKPLVENNKSIIDKFDTIIRQADQASNSSKQEPTKKTDTTIEETSSPPIDKDHSTDESDSVPQKKDDDSIQYTISQKLVQSQIEIARLSAICQCLKEQNEKLWNLVEQLLKGKHLISFQISEILKI